MLSTAVLAGALWTFQTCASGAPPLALAGIADQESGYYEDSIFDNTAWTSLHFSSPNKAIDAASTLIAQGHQIDVGLLGIDFTSWTRHGVPIVAAFDNCMNAKISGEILMGDYSTAQKAGFKGYAAWLQTFSLYNSGCFYPRCEDGRRNEAGERYANAIASHIHELQQQVAVAERSLTLMNAGAPMALPITPAAIPAQSEAAAPTASTPDNGAYEEAVRIAHARQVQAQRSYQAIERAAHARAQATPTPTTGGPK